MLNTSKVTVVGAVMAAASVVVAPSAFAQDWDELAQCESSGNWQYPGTNGYYGGLQFKDSTWDAYGGEKYAPTADKATREQQIAIAEKTLAGQGHGAWPGCSGSTNWEGGSTAPVNPMPRTVPDEVPSAVTGTVPKVTESVPTYQPPAMPADVRVTLRTEPAGPGEYRIESGDSLTEIGLNHRVDWPVVFEANRDVVEHPDWIFPGEILEIPVIK